MQLKPKQIGLALIFVAIALAFLVFSYSINIIKANAQACGCAGGCPHAMGLPLQSLFGIVIIVVLAFLSYSLIVSSRKITEVKEELAKKVSKLQGEERSIYNAIMEADGAMLQSEIVDKLKLSKVKVTRLLDKLEGKGLIERRRRGMTNLVLLKRN